MCMGIHTYKIGLILYKKIRAAKLKKWCVYVCRKGGGLEHIGLKILYIILHFCFTCFDTFFF